MGDTVPGAPCPILKRTVATLEAFATVRHPINYQSDESGQQWKGLMKDTGQLRRSQTTSGYLVV